MAARLGDWSETEERQVADDAFERLFMAEYGRVVAIAQRVLVDGQAAEDVAQEVFLAFHRRHTPDAPYAAAWLHKAAAHTALNVVRARRRRRSREQTEALVTQRLITANSDDDPQRALEVAEQRLEVRQALSRLPVRSASALVLRYSGLSYAEVAAALDISVNQVGTLLRRAESVMRKEMTDDTPR